MGIINFIRKMRNYISAALLAFVASAQAGFLTEDYADEGRNLAENCGDKVEVMRKAYCSDVLKGRIAGPEYACDAECDGDIFVGNRSKRTSIIHYKAQDNFCGFCCDKK